MWEALYYLAASLLISALFTPKTKQQGNPPASQEDFDFPQFEEGTPQAVIFGECWTSSWMVLGTTNFRVAPITRSGGKK